MIPISAPTRVGPTKVLCPVMLTIRPKPTSVKAICTKTPSVMSARTLAAASGRRGPFGLWEKDPPCKRIEKYRDCEMKSYDCGNCPTCGSEGCADLGQPLPNKQNCEERSP